MSIAGLGTFQSKTSYYAMFRGGKGNDLGAQDSFNGKLAQDDAYGIWNDKNMLAEVSGESEASKDMDAMCIPIMSKGYGDPAAYTRCITANIKTREAYAQQNSDGEVIYSYRETEQSFNIIINSDGKDKTYTIKGIDENGEEFERAFDPYDLDPEDMDYPEFSALCMYIRQTDETADLIASSYFTDTSYFDGIFDRGDRVSLLGRYADEYGDSEPSLACLANQIFDAINTFFDRAMKGSGFSEEAFSLLFEDLDDAETREKISALKNGDTDPGNTTGPISETVVSKQNQYTDPDTGAVVPVNIKYITAYTDRGISCKEITDDGGKISQRDLWTLSYNSPDSYEKVQEFLKSFSEDQNLTFAPQEKFWKDFMKDDFDIDGFRAYYDSTDNGKIDFEKARLEGRNLRDVLTEPYAEYINNNHFIGWVLTEQEIWDEWNAKIEANQRAVKANGTGVEPPTETIITTSNKGASSTSDVSAMDELKQANDDKPVWNWYNGRLGFYADVYKTGENDSEYKVRLRYDDGREEERIVDLDKINASNCDIVNLHLKMYHLRDEGKIDQEDMMMDLTMAHFYMEQKVPGADENTNINFRSWYVQQLELEINNARDGKNISRLINLLEYL